MIQTKYYSVVGMIEMPPIGLIGNMFLRNPDYLYIIPDKYGIKPCNINAPYVNVPPEYCIHMDAICVSRQTYDPFQSILFGISSITRFSSTAPPTSVETTSSFADFTSSGKFMVFPVVEISISTPDNYTVFQLKSVFAASATQAVQVLPK